MTLERSKVSRIRLLLSLIFLIKCLSKKLLIGVEYRVSNFRWNPFSKNTQLFQLIRCFYITSPGLSFSLRHLPKDQILWFFSFFLSFFGCESLCAKVPDWMASARNTVRKDLILWYFFIVNVTQDKYIHVNLTDLYQGDHFRGNGTQYTLYQQRPW